MNQTLKRIVLALPILPVLGYIIYMATMNYTGYCFEQKRYLSKDEKIKAAIEHVLFSYPKEGDPAPLRSLVIDIPTERNPLKVKPSYIIGYEDVNHFLENNPACCEVKRVIEDTEHIPLSGIDLLLGFVSDFVTVKYKMMYIDQDGNKRKEEVYTFKVVNSCGRIVSQV